jgi:flagellar biosynthesis/type III secretory pathway M-ring protein FliF/YscJ
MSSPQMEMANPRRTLPLLTAILVAALIFVALVLVTRKYLAPAPLGAERAAERAKARAELTATETEQLTTVGYADPIKGVVRLPIAEAIKLAEQQWQDPAKARAELIARKAKESAPPPKVPAKPSEYE